MQFGFDEPHPRIWNNTSRERPETKIPAFINVDSQGLESPLDLLGSQEPLDDHQPCHPWFGLAKILIRLKPQTLSLDSIRIPTGVQLSISVRGVCLQQRQHVAHAVLVAVGLRLLRNRIRMIGGPAQGRHTPQIPLQVLQHMNEFMADQHAADHWAHRPLLDHDRAQPARFRPIGGVLAR